MSRGLFGLATVAAAAPFFGMIGTLLGIVGCFGGVTGEKLTIMAAIAKCLSESLMPAAFGLGIAITALWGYRSFSAQMGAFQTEIQNAVLEMTKYLDGQ